MMPYDPLEEDDEWEDDRREDDGDAMLVSNGVLDTFRRIFRAPIRKLPLGVCLPPDNLDPTNPSLSREEWAETRTCQVCGIAGEDVSASRRCSSCEKHDIMPETQWDREHPESL